MIKNVNKIIFGADNISSVYFGKRLIYNAKVWKISDFRINGDTVFGFSDSGQKKGARGKVLDLRCLPSNVTTIGSMELSSYGKAIEKIIVGKNIRILKSFAFVYSETLKEIILPDELKRIEAHAIIAKNLRTIRVPKKCIIEEYGIHSSIQIIRY